MFLLRLGTFAHSKFRYAARLVAFAIAQKYLKKIVRYISSYPIDLPTYREYLDFIMTNAKTFYRNQFMKLRPPTERKIISAARKAAVSDSMSELVHWLGTYVRDEKLKEFARC